MRTSGLLLLLPALFATHLAAAEPSVRDMKLTTPDGFQLKGTLTVPARGQRHPVVVLAHQFGADRSGWQPLIEHLQACGIATLALDLRGHGQSTQDGDTEVKVTEDFMASAKTVGFDKIPGDLAQVAAWVRRQPGIDPNHLGLAGSSVGAFAALMAMPKVRPVVVLALSPAGTGAFGKDGTAALAQAVSRSKAAVMVMASRSDEDAATNAQALSGIPGVYTRVVDGKEHGFAYLAAQSDTMAVFLITYLKDRHRGQPAPAAAEPEAAQGQ